MGGAVLVEAKREEGDFVCAGAFEKVVPEGGRVVRKGGIRGIVGSCKKAANCMSADHLDFGG